MHGRPIGLPELHRHLHVRESTGDFVDEWSRSVHENFEGEMAQYRESQQSSDSTCDPIEEQQHALDAWKKSVGPQRSGRLAGTGSIGPSIFEKARSIIPSRGQSSSTDSTGRSAMPTAADLQNVQQLAQKLSEVENQLSEQQRLSNEQREHHEQEMQEHRLMIEHMCEQTKINEERWKRFVDDSSPDAFHAIIIFSFTVPVAATGLQRCFSVVWCLPASLPDPIW